MSSSQNPLKPHFSLTFELLFNGYGWLCYDRGRDKDKGCYFRTMGPLNIEITNPVPWKPDLSYAELYCPDFDFADVAAGLPEVEAIIDALHHRSGDISAQEFYHAGVNVYVKGGIENSAANTLLGKKIATLVFLLEESLLLKLVAPSRWPRQFKPVSKESRAARCPAPQCDVVSFEYASHVPRTAAMEPAAKNNRDPELMYRKLAMVWSAPSLQELEHILATRCDSDCNFFLVVHKEPVNMCTTPRRVEGKPEPKRVWFRFRYLQMTFDHALLRNWVEIIARIIELALAGPDEYKRCLEAIFRIQHETGQGGVAWEQLMKHVLNLEHRIPDWRDQLARYERGEVIAGLSEDGLLARRMGPFYSQPSSFYNNCGYDPDPFIF
ncbi:hypothetical protein NCS56_00214600 [Fusarium sp. Ph1]|nr:hypothetical protein NCS56_00214600 [Fusarium sp. Ph1]